MTLYNQITIPIYLFSKVLSRWGNFMDNNLTPGLSKVELTIPCVYIMAKQRHNYLWMPEYPVIYIFPDFSCNLSATSCRRHWQKQRTMLMTNQFHDTFDIVSGNEMYMKQWWYTERSGNEIEGGLDKWG